MADEVKHDYDAIIRALGSGEGKAMPDDVVDKIVAKCEETLDVALRKAHEDHPVIVTALLQTIKDHKDAVERATAREAAALAIVRDLAGWEDPSINLHKTGTMFCGLCLYQTSPTGGGKREVNRHAESCPYRRAVDLDLSPAAAAMLEVVRAARDSGGILGLYTPLDNALAALDAALGTR